MRYALALLAFLVACRGPMSQAPAPELPPIPAQTTSQLGAVAVVWVDSLTNAEGKQMLGGFHTIRRTIYLRRDLLQNPRAAWVVYLHETCHVWMNDSGLSEAMTTEVQQQVCDAQAVYRVAEVIQTRKPR